MTTVQPHTRYLALCVLTTTPFLWLASAHAQLRGFEERAPIAAEEEPGAAPRPSPGAPLSPFDARPAHEIPRLASLEFGSVLASLRHELTISLGSLGGPGLAPQYEATIRLRGGDAAGECGESCELIQARLRNEAGVYTLFENDGTPRRFDGANADRSEAAPRPGVPFVGATLHTLNDGGVAVVEIDRTVRTFDASGRMRTLSNAFGQIDFDYDADGRLKMVTAANGEFLELRRAAGGLLTAVVSPNGTLDLEYEAQNLAAVAGPAFSEASRMGLAMTWMSTADGQAIASVAEPGKRAQQIWYDENGRVATVNEANGTQRRFRADAEHIAVSDSRGTNVSTEYRDGRPVQVVSNEGESRFFSYGARGELLEERALTWEGESLTQFTYDAAGRAATMSTADSSVSYLYADTDTNAFPSQIIESDTLGNETRMRFDEEGRVTERARLGRAETWSYDAAGNMIEHVDMFGNRSTRVVDHRGLTLSVTRFGATESFTYDASGLPLTQQDAYGRVRRHDYDARGELVGSRGAGAPEMSMHHAKTADGTEVTVRVGAREAKIKLDGLHRVVEAKGSNASTKIGYDAINGRPSELVRLVNGREWVERVTYNNTGAVETHDVNDRRQKSADRVTAPGVAGAPSF